MNRDQKAAVVDDIAEQIGAAEAVFAVDYRGISVPQVAELRTRLREADATFRIVKNSLTERAADRAGEGDIKALLDGPTALTFVRGDAAVAAKALADAQKATEVLGFKGGIMGGAVVTAEDIAAIARLPARDVLYGRLVGIVAAPLTGLVRSLGGLVGGLAVQLAQIQEQGLVGGEPPAVEAPAEADAPATTDAEADAPATHDAEAHAPEQTDDTDTDPDTGGADGVDPKED